MSGRAPVPARGCAAPQPRGRRGSLVEADAAGGHAGALAMAVRAVAAGRQAGDPVALHAALIDLAAAALAYAEVAAAGE